MGRFCLNCENGAKIYTKQVVGCMSLEIEVNGSLSRVELHREVANQNLKSKDPHGSLC